MRDSDVDFHPAKLAAESPGGYWYPARALGQGAFRELQPHGVRQESSRALQSPGQSYVLSSFC